MNIYRILFGSFIISSLFISFNIENKIPTNGEKYYFFYAVSSTWTGSKKCYISHVMQFYGNECDPSIYDYDFHNWGKRKFFKDLQKKYPNEVFSYSTDVLVIDNKLYSTYDKAKTYDEIVKRQDYYVSKEQSNKYELFPFNIGCNDYYNRNKQ